MEKFIKLPKTIKDLRIKHFKALTDPVVTFESPTLADKCYFISVFSGVELHLVKEFTKANAEKMYNYVVGIFDQFKPRNTPAKEITLNGKQYERIDPEKVATSWHVDWDVLIKQKEVDELKLACMFYFPKGCVYGKLDENKNFIHPLRERMQDFEQMELTIFMESRGFFLRKLNKSNLLSTVKKRSTQRTKQYIKSMIG